MKNIKSENIELPKNLKKKKQESTKPKKKKQESTLVKLSLGVYADSVLPLAVGIKGESDGTQDFRNIVIKHDTTNRPITILPSGHIFCLMFTDLSKTASDFLITVAEPVSRPENIHEYQLTIFSIYAAVSVGMQVEEIIHNLDKFSRNVLHDDLIRSLHSHGEAFGKLKLVLRDNRHFIEAAQKYDLEYLLKSAVINEARIRNTMTVREIVNTSSSIFNKENLEKPGDDDIGEDKVLVYSFEIRSDRVGKVKEAALTDLKRPLLSEYDFRRDLKNPNIEISLKPSTKIRYYQERCMRKMFSNGRARSGLIVLPCGAGKTLTGIIASTTIRKSTMVLTSSAVAVDQWRRAYTEFTSISPEFVIALTSDTKRELPDNKVGVVIISTYTMLAHSGKRSEMSEKIINQIQSREWGLLIFDEVQFAPAPAFRRITDIVQSHCKLGLTATLVREDDLIHDLQWLIGPKLYEANWLELQEAGYLAKVHCSEIWCNMVGSFFAHYVKVSHSKQRKLWVCNPNKLRVCEYLIRFHESRRDKIIVFSDNIFALKEVAKSFNKPFISGEVTMQERMLIISKFKTDTNFSTIFLSKVGDNAIDLPCANVVIQISFNFASRRQEAQRLGRILRPKPKNSNEEFNAYFYSLVSKDTQEMIYADKRQQFIIDQGYAYKVLNMSIFPLDDENLVYDDVAKQQQILFNIIKSDDKQWDIEEDDVILNDSSIDINKLGKNAKGETNLSNLSEGKNIPKKRNTENMHSLFKKYFNVK